MAAGYGYVSGHSTGYGPNTPVRPPRSPGTRSLGYGRSSGGGGFELIPGYHPLTPTHQNLHQGLPGLPRAQAPFPANGPGFAGNPAVPAPINRGGSQAPAPVAAMPGTIPIPPGGGAYPYQPPQTGPVYMPPPGGYVPSYRPPPGGFQPGQNAPPGQSFMTSSTGQRLALRQAQIEQAIRSSKPLMDLARQIAVQQQLRQALITARTAGGR